jgi:hypothetical protein
MIAHSVAKRLLVAFSLSCAALIGTNVGALAQQAQLVAGTLTCHGRGSVGLILGSRQNLTCSYEPQGAAPRQRYAARITRLGIDIGVKGPSVMVWTVLGSTSALPLGALAGRFVGVSANASVGIGGGANALIGGNGNSVILQPLSVQGQTGVNVAAGVAGLRLTHLGQGRAH